MAEQPRDRSGRFTFSPHSKQPKAAPAHPVHLGEHESASEDESRGSSGSAFKSAAAAVGRGLWKSAKFAGKIAWVAVSVPVALVAGFVIDASGIEVRLARRKRKKLQEWRGDALAMPVRFTSREEVKNGWHRLQEIAERQNIFIDMSGSVTDGVDMWDMGGGMEGVALPDFNRIGLDPNMDLPRQTAVLAHEIAHLADPKVQAEEVGAVHAAQPDKEVVAELSSHLFCAAYGIDTTDRAERYIEGWAARTPGGKAAFQRDQAIDRVHKVVGRLLPRGHEQASLRSVRDAYAKLIGGPGA